MHQILALWCHPRSLSTAFGRMMMERGDISVLHERFLYLYYVVQNPDLVIAQQLERVEPWMQASFDEVVEGIESEASRRPVFFKDMAVHVHNPKGRYADEAFLGRYSNAFLIRDPAIAVPSHLKQNPEMIFEEVGYDAQFALFEVVSQMTGAAPPVIDAADLEEDPEMIVQAYCDAMRIPFVSSALRWGSAVPSQLSEGDPWHADLFATTGFERRVETFSPDLARHPKYTEYCERSMPFYQAMREHRIG